MRDFNNRCSFDTQFCVRCFYGRNLNGVTVKVALQCNGYRMRSNIQTVFDTTLP